MFRALLLLGFAAVSCSVDAFCFPDGAAGSACSCIFYSAFFAACIIRSFYVLAVSFCWLCNLSVWDAS
ncbi:hypothetical protein SOVF_100050, partial [Spinacia oleracea]